MGTTFNRQASYLSIKTRMIPGLTCLQHLRSRIHCPSDVQCPFCQTTRSTATGLVHHLERGNCPNAPLDRDKLYRIIRQKDPNGVIAKKLLEGSGPKTYERLANSNSWNPRRRGYECYLCHRLFNSLHGLDQHITSPVHQQSLYHCPNRACGRDFTTLAAVMNHLESESCNFMRFSAVQKNVQRIVNPRNMIQF